MATEAAISPPALKPIPTPSQGFQKILKDVTAGTCGGISVTLIGHPFDTIKVRLQTQPTVNPLYGGMVDCARKTVQWEGLGGLYKGVQSPLLGQMVFRASLFSAFGASKRYFATNADGSPRELQTIDFYKAGFITGFIAAFSEGPIDYYKSQTQIQIIRSKADPTYKPPFTTMAESFRQSFTHRGWRAPFQGIGPTILRNAPANSIYLGSFEAMKQASAKQMNCKTSELPGYVVLGSAGLGGIMYWCAIFPVDVVKSAMQTDSMVKAERKYYGFRETVGKLWAEGGVGRFYRGFAPCLVRAAPANAAMLYTVDTVNNMLHNH